MSEKKCPVCGETDPWPAWFCVMRLAGEAKKGKPCPYSREGDERRKAKLEKAARKIAAVKEGR